jgi:glyoxylase-like metal-dependent hydrolase (beta-lactamase superfamily II)
MTIHAEPTPLAGPLPGGTEGATVTVEPMSGGEVQFPRAFFESTGGRFANLRATGIGTPRSRWTYVPCPAFLIRHPSAGLVLVDTSLHPSVAARPRANMGYLNARMWRPRIDPGRDLPAQLRAKDVDPRSIPTLVMTHLHFDHASGMAEFPDSRIIVTAAEWEAATTEARPFLHGYRHAHYDYVFDYKTLTYDGPSITSYATFGLTFDLFGDGSIRLASTPGHTPGHQSVICRLRDRDFVIAGDAVYTRNQLEGGPPPPRPQDPHLWRRSLRELQRFHEQFPQAVIVPGHDPGHFASLEESYA